MQLVNNNKIKARLKFDKRSVPVPIKFWLDIFRCARFCIRREILGSFVLFKDKFLFQKDPKKICIPKQILGPNKI